MPYEQQCAEWKLLKDQFDALIRNERARSDDVDELLFDDEIRRRFGEMISSSLLKPRARRRYS
jgi:hypothetical protein